MPLCSIIKYSTDGGLVNIHPEPRNQELAGKIRKKRPSFTVYSSNLIN